MHILLNAIFVPDEAGEFIAADPSLTPLLQASSELPHGDYGTTFVKMFLTLIALIVLFGVSLWFLRRLIQQRKERGSGDELIQVLEKRMLSPKTMLYVVEIEGVKIVLAESQLEIRKVQEFGANKTYPDMFGSSNDPQD